VTDSVPTIRIKLLRNGARIPQRATEGATGYDVYAALEGDSVEIGQHPTVVPTGIAMEVPPGLDAQLRPRSGLARQGILATFGTLDPDYRGELMITLYSIAPDIRHTVCDGDRIAQLVLAHVVHPILVAAHELSDTARGERGHGSTGR
jgi:dUTP pyrophosphatase